MPTTGTAGDDLLSAVDGGDTLIGLAGNDTLVGGSGDDSLAGGDGDDRILGSLGFDTMSGGAGVNIFQFAQTGDSQIGAALIGGLGHMDHIVDWTSQDFLQFFGEAAPTALNYQEITAPDLITADNQAMLAAAQHGAVYTVAQVGADVIVIDAHFGYAVDLEGATLAEVSPSNMGPMAGAVAPPPPVVATGGMGGLVTVSGNMDAANLHDLLPGTVTEASVNEFTLSGPGDLRLDIQGAGFTYLNNALTGGKVTGIDFTDVSGGDTVLHFSVSGDSVDAGRLQSLLSNGDTAGTFTLMLAGNDTLSGVGAGTNVIHGYGGADLLYGAGGTDSLFGGDGDDTIYGNLPPGVAGAGSTAQTYLRGEDGDDSITGADGFDDINGNMGNDTIHGGNGDDYSVGGKDNDLLFGDAGNDIVWGNLGNDTCDGGDGNDQVRGGQGDDSCAGGAGDDFISGDRGNDTESGGAGADIFHTSQDAGIDRVLDFHIAEGDRVQVDPGTTFTVSQMGADTVIDMGAGNEMILVGVQMSTLTGNWIFGA